MPPAGSLQLARAAAAGAFTLSRHPPHGRGVGRAAHSPHMSELPAQRASPAPSVLLRRVHGVLEELGGAAGPALRDRAGAVAPAVPEWIAREEWGGYLIGLEDATLEKAEAEGLRAVLRDDPAAPDSLRTVARSLDAIEEHLLSPPSDSTRSQVHAETQLSEQRKIWDSRCRQLERYYKQMRGALPSNWTSSPHLHRKATQPPPKGTVLREWVDEQRHLFAQGQLSAHRAERLLCTGLQLAKRNHRRRGASAASTPMLAPTDGAAQSPPFMKDTKARQVSALAGAAQEYFDGTCMRVVDVGCGRGHLTRWLSQKLGVRALGLERDASLVVTATGLSKVSVLPSRAHSSRSSSRGMPAAVAEATAAAVAAAAAAVDDEEGNAEPQQVETEFEQCDARAPGSLSRVLRAGDLVVALHPCGPLGESVVQAVSDASKAGAAMQMLLVSCCLAGRGGAEVPDPRPPASRTGQHLGLLLPRTGLKKANLGLFANGDAVGPMHRRREARLAMRLLLEARGMRVPAGREMDFLSKRSQSGTSVERLLGISRGSEDKTGGGGRESGGHASGEEGKAMANAALAARGLASLREGESAAVARAAAEAMPALRRLELLDVLVGDAVELSVNLDRACVLEEAGLHVAVGRLFPRSVSPRNLAIVASTSPLRTRASPTDLRVNVSR